MNVVFISISAMPDVSEHSISLDLLRELQKRNHNVYIVCSCDEVKKKTQLIDEHGFHVLRVKIGRNKKANIIRKGITTLMLPYRYVKMVKKMLSKVKFDLVLYPTPPVTHANTIRYIKKRDNAKTYLLLKDIFPQNAVDIGMISKSGIKGIIYKYFRAKEKKLYKLSDAIGCMSPANVEYLLKHNPEIPRDKVEVCPNSIEVLDMSVSSDEREDIRTKYDIPLDKIVFVYGGNLGKPQGISFLIECLKSQAQNEKAYFLIVGDGTEFNKIDTFIKNSGIENVKLLRRLPKADYDRLVAACDVGLIFLDYRFTIPNFPSRLLGYLQANLPVFACTDCNSDMGKIIVENKLGWWCESNNIDAFDSIVRNICIEGIPTIDGIKFLNDNYSSDRASETILKAVERMYK